MVVKRYKGTILVDFRKYWQSPYTGEFYSTDRGLSLFPSSFITLFLSADEIDQKIYEPIFKHRVQLGKDIFCSLARDCYTRNKYVNIRQYIREDEKLQPTIKNGICLKISEWTCLKGYLVEIKNTTPLLSQAIPCPSLSDHNKRVRDEECIICHPFDVEINYFC